MTSDKGRGALLIIFCTIFLDMLGVGILIPVVPVLLADPMSSHYLLAPGTSEREGFLYLGALIATFSIGQFFASPVIGQLADKFGRRPILLFSIAGTAIGHALFAAGIVFRSITLLFIARLFSGVTAGNIVVAQAAIADMTRPEDRAKNFGLISAAFGLGFIIGPFFGGKLADPELVSWFSAATPFYFASLLSLTNVVFAYVFFSETRPGIRGGETIRMGRAFQNILRAFAQAELRPLFTTSFIMQGGFAFYMTFASVYLLTHFGFTEQSIGNYFAYVGIWIVMTQLFVTRLLSGRLSEKSILTISIIGMGLSIWGIVLAPNATYLYVVIPFFAIATGLSQSNLTGLLSRTASPSIQGEVLGLNSSVNALAIAIPPLFSGIIASFLSAAAPLVVAGGIIICAGLYFTISVRARL